MPDIPLDDGVVDRTASLKLREADFTKHLTDNNQEEEKAKATEVAANQFNFTPSPRPKDVDEKLLKPEPGEIVSKHDYELNQAIAFLKSRSGTRVAN